jgi:hypothetical protein
MQAVSKSHADFISLLIVFIFCNVAGKTKGIILRYFLKITLAEFDRKVSSDNSAIKIPAVLDFSIFVLKNEK